MATSPLLSSLASGSLLPSPLIPANFSPSYNLNISYPAESPSNGSLVRVSDVATQPSVTFSAIADTPPSSAAPQNFTFLLLDPDAPTPDDPKFAFWRHWVVTNIPAGAEDVGEGTTLTAYLAPGPKDESGPHRYLFLLFREKEGFAIGREDVGGEEFVERRSFGAREFVVKHALELVGVQWMRGVGDGWNGGRDEL